MNVAAFVFVITAFTIGVLFGLWIAQPVSPKEPHP
jgi:uncharacterized protein YneF (UPF0154 family)